jgi:hypothetical protein
LAGAPPAKAQNVHSFVSAGGTGTTCSFSTPCATINGAIQQTASNGLVTCVDQGANSFGNSIVGVVVDRSVTIDCGGTSASAWFFVVNGAGIVVTLRNLAINGLGNDGGPGIGIDFQNGAALFVEHCVIEHNESGGSIGINFAPSGTARLHVTDSIIKSNGNGSSGGGIVVKPSSGQVQVMIERTIVENNTYGIFANGTAGAGSIIAQIRDSTVANSAVNGISAFTGAAIAAVVVDHSSSVMNGGSGILAQGSGGLVFLTDTTVLSNHVGLSTAAGGTIFSYGNNRLTGNTSDGVAPAAGAFALK